MGSIGRTHCPQNDFNDSKIEFNDSKILNRNNFRVINDSKIKQVNNHGSLSWMYRGTDKQQIMKSIKKYSKDQFLKLINDKFASGEWI